ADARSSVEAQSVQRPRPSYHPNHRPSRRHYAHRHGQGAEANYAEAEGRESSGALGN
nr:hypothetical protein [Tanacetum cinerariifolium]